MENNSTLLPLLESVLNRELISITLSNPKRRESPAKVKLRPLLLRGELLFQRTATVGPKELHQNDSPQQALSWLVTAIPQEYRQTQILTPAQTITLLSNKRGEVAIRRSPNRQSPAARALDHNRKKQYLLQEGCPVPFLVDLGVMTPQGKVVAAKYDKFRQINRFLEFLQDILPHLPRDREITVLDFGCGKSYLTFAVYHYLHTLLGLAVRVIGLDLKEDVIAACNRLSQSYGYQGLTFLQGDIASYQGVSQVDLVITLHACDTATDHALAKAVGWGARVILSVPCCQHELNTQLDCPPLEPVLRYGLLRERMAALLTDGIRAQYLEAQGYQTQILEFIDMEHTPKNILIRAVKNPRQQVTAQRREQAEGVEAFLHASLTLGQLLRAQDAQQPPQN